MSMFNVSMRLLLDGSWLGARCKRLFEFPGVFLGNIAWVIRIAGIALRPVLLYRRETSRFETQLNSLF